MNRNAAVRGIAYLSAFVTAGYLLWLLPTIQIEAKLVRDTGIDNRHRYELAQLKHHLEQHHNTYGFYPLKLSVKPPHRYIVTVHDDHTAQAWYVRTPLRADAVRRSGIDERRGYGFTYRIVRVGANLYFDICGGAEDCHHLTP